MSFSWFRLNFPKTAFNQVNATIGGTGSDLGVFRLEHDVFTEKPDLLFVEFAVNDGNTPTSLRAMEGIVRKTWAAFPNTDICFIYTTAEPLRLQSLPQNFWSCQGGTSSCRLF